MITGPYAFKVLGREMRWEKVEELMQPTEKGLPANAGIFSSAIVAMTKSKRWSLALQLEKVQTCLS